MEMHHVETLIPAEDLLEGIRETAERINRDYAGREVHLVCLLKGGVFYMTELSKYLTVPVTFGFMSVSSYGSGTKSSGVVKIVKDLDEPIEGKDVLVVEDIIDSGNTLSYILELLRGRRPNSLKLTAMLDKPSRRVREVKVDYTCFVVEDKFVVGYGLDYDQFYRNLPYIGEIVFDDQPQE